MLKAVLCDIDGTLVDSNVLHAEAWVRAFAHFGYNFTRMDILHQIGKGGDQAAGNTGISTVAVTSGGWDEDQLYTAGAVAVYEGVAKIAEVFERSEFSR